MELEQITRVCHKDGGFLFKYGEHIICRKCNAKVYYDTLKKATKITLLSQETIDRLASES